MRCPSCGGEFNPGPGSALGATHCGACGPAPSDGLAPATPQRDLPPGDTIHPQADGDADADAAAAADRPSALELSHARVGLDSRAARGAPSPHDTEGTAFGRYRLLQALGAGGMGAVWKAWDTELRRIVALKLIRDDLEVSGGEALGRFLREARLAAKLRHPHIVGVRDVGELDGRHYITMDYVEGRTLAALLEETRAGKRAGTRLGLDRLRREVELVSAVAEAAGYAHRQGVVHRDLKPANVLVDREWRPFVMDFGLAKAVVPEASGDGGSGPGPVTSMTLGGQLLGTPAYMSPEQAAGDLAQVGPKTDVWALGVIVYEVLCGCLPFEGKSPLQMLGAAVKEEPPAPRRRNPLAPAELEAVCLKALEKDPARRYATAEDLAAELRRWLAGEPVRARRPGPADRALRWAARHRALVAAAAAVLLVLAGALGWGRYERARRAERARRILDEVAASVQGLQDSLMKVDATLEAQQALVEQPLGMLDRWLAEDPGLGPVYSWRGRVREILGDERAAAADFDRGCSLSPDRPEVWFLRGMSRIWRYWESRSRWLVNARAGGSGVAFAALPPETPAERDLRGQGLADLERAVRLPAPRGIMPTGDLRLARGMLAFASERPGRCEEALALLHDLETPWSWSTQAMALCFLQRYPEAVVSYGKVVAAWPADVAAWRMRGIARLAVGWQRLGAGHDPRQEFRDAIQDFGEAFRRRRGLPEVARTDTYDFRACAQVSLAEAEALFGTDPRAILRAAIQDFDQALALDPGRSLTYGNRSAAWRRLGQLEAAAGADPRACYRNALADCDSALKRDPGSSSGWANRADTHRALGAAEAERGDDPILSYGRALADYTESLRLEPDFVLVYNNRAMTYDAQGEAEGRRHDDPRASFRRAAADCDEAIRRAPRQGEPFNTRGLAAWHLAEAEAERGGDPEPAFARAEADFRGAAERNVKLSLVNLGLLLRRRGRFGEALEAFETAARAVPGYAASLRKNIETTRRELAGALDGYCQELNRTDRWIQAGDYVGARSRYESALAIVHDELRHMPADLKQAWLGTPAVRAALAAAWYNLACIESLLADGKEGPAAAPRPRVEAGRALHRERALLALLEAVQFGYRDADHARTDADLAPVQGDPRFRAILESAR